MTTATQPMPTTGFSNQTYKLNVHLSAEIKTLGNQVDASIQNDTQNVHNIDTLTSRIGYAKRMQFLLSQNPSMTPAMLFNTIQKEITAEIKYATDHKADSPVRYAIAVRSADVGLALIKDLKSSL